MNKSIIAAVCFLIALPLAARSQEVMIEGFPLGVGGSISPSFFEPYYPQLQALADTLEKYPLVFAVVTGAADGEQYRENNDAKNPGLALGRAHSLRNVLVSGFGVDSARIIIQSSDVKSRGDRYRCASVRIAWELAGLEARVDSLEQRPPVEKQITEVRGISGILGESMGLQLGAGLSSSPFGVIPIVSGALTWKKVIFVEGVVGHTIWSGDYRLGGADLTTWRRLAGGQVIVRPFAKVPVGAVGGWVRIEQISRRYYRYVKMSEGPVVGLRVTPFDFLSVTGVYNPAKHIVATEDNAKSKVAQFLISATAHISFGGKR